MPTSIATRILWIHCWPAITVYAKLMKFHPSIQGFNLMTHAVNDHRGNTKHAKRKAEKPTKQHLQTWKPITKATMLNSPIAIPGNEPSTFHIFIIIIIFLMTSTRSRLGFLLWIWFLHNEILQFAEIFGQMNILIL